MKKYYCINCGKEATQFHHVVPKEFGGNNTTNCVWLCDNCHSIVHGLSFGNGQISHGELVKEGIRKAKEKGYIVGRKPFQITEAFLKAYELYDIKAITGLEAAKRAGCGTTTFYKYIQKIKAGEIKLNN